MRKTIRLEIYPSIGEAFYVDVDSSEICTPREDYEYEVDDELVESWIDDHLINVEFWDVDAYLQ